MDIEKYTGADEVVKIPAEIGADFFGIVNL